MNHGFFLVFFLFVLVVVGIGILAWMQERKRREALRAVAARNGWTFIERDTHDRPNRYKGFEPFGQGHSRYASHVFIGAEEQGAFEVFDYHYAVTRSNGKQTHTDHYHFKMVALPMPLAAPNLLVRDEHLGHKLFDALGGEDIDFESHEFSKRFWVRCDDRRFAYDVIHPGMMEYLLPLKGWTWQWRGRLLLLHRSGKLSPSDVKSTLETALGFRRLVPRHLVAAARPSTWANA